MIENHFPFGGKFGMDQYKNAQSEWKYYFNYGYCTNEMKWQATEKVHSFDLVSDFFRSKASEIIQMAIK